MWLDAYRMETKTSIVKPVGVTLWGMETRRLPSQVDTDGRDRAASLSDHHDPPGGGGGGSEGAGINHNLITIDGPVKITLTKPQLMFLRQVLDE